MGRGKRQRYFTEAASSQLSLSYSSDRRLIPRIKEVSGVSADYVRFFQSVFPLCPKYVSQNGDGKFVDIDDMASTLQAQYRYVLLTRTIVCCTHSPIRARPSEYARRKKNAFRIIVENGSLPSRKDMQWLLKVTRPCSISDDW